MKLTTSRPLFPNQSKTTKKIAHFWDSISHPWEEIWGPHIHHGYFEPDDISPEQAQVVLVKKLCDVGGIIDHQDILDAGCGIGGSSIYLAKHFSARVTGITLSPYQVKRAKERAHEEVCESITFRLDDALAMETVQDSSCDVVWSVEACEQFFDKSQFFKQAHRVLRDNGKLIVATWCSNLEEYTDKEAKKYQKLCKAFDVPYMPTMKKYVKLLEKSGFTMVRSEDWTQHVKKSWSLGIARAHKKSFWYVFKHTGFRGLRFVNQLWLMHHAYKTGQVKYGVFVAVKK